MRLPHLAVKRPIAVFMVVCIVLLIGGVSLSSLPLDLFPNMQLPIAAVITSYSGAAPSEVEAMVTRPLEDSLGTVQNIRNLSSTSSPGSSTILLELDWGTDMDMALLEVRERLDMVRGYLPDGVSSPQVMKADPSMMPILQLEVAGDGSLEELYLIAENIIKPRLERQDGVAMVSLGGGGLKQVQVTVDPFLLGHYGVSIDQVAQTLRMENINIAAGTLLEGGKNYQVRTIGEYRSIEDIKSLNIMTPSGSYRLKDVATVNEVTDGGNRINRYNGQSSISIDINKQSDANTVMVSRRVAEALAEMESDLPAHVSVHKVMDQAEFIMDSIKNVSEVGLFGGILAIAILFFFLRNIRSTLIIALAIPVSVVATFVLMFFNGLTLNLVTLGGLALGLGIMVDNSIVVLENIFRLRQEGTPSLEAAPEGTSQVAGAIIAATLTTVVVFLPVVFVEGIASQIFSPLAMMVSFSLLASLVVALTVVPVLASKLIKGVGTIEDRKKTSNGPKKESLFNRLLKRVEKFYTKALVWSLSHKGIVMTFLIVSFVGSLALIPHIGQEFLPNMDDGYISIRVNLPVGADKDETFAIAREVEEHLLTVPEVRGASLSIGGSGSMGFGTGSTNRARMEIVLKDISKRERSAAEVGEALRQEFRDIPGAEISVTASGQGVGGMMGSSSPISIALRGDDLEELKRISADVAEIIRGIEGTREVEAAFEQGRPELQIVVDRDIAAAYGLTGAQAGSLLRTALTGQTVSRLRSGGREKDIILTLPPGAADSRASLEQLPLLSPLGGLVSLGEIANFEDTLGPTSINRHNQVRTTTVSGEISGRDLGSVIADIKRELKEYPLPDGYIIDYEGEQQLMQSSFDDLYKALALAVLLVYMIMAAQFESLLHPLIIMFTLPQAVTGVLISLFITGRALSVVSLIGVIMLAGIVVNNGIVLIDYVNFLREKKGISCREALLEAGPVRLRPILMTTMTTVLGMFPLALGLGSGGELQAPMATVVVGGLLFSTVLTLVVVPVVYALTEDIKIWIANRMAKRKSLGIEER